jgi:Tetratricopeptide repeat
MSLPFDPSRGGPRSPSMPDAEAVREEFLFHLYRGSELLQDGRVHEAKESLESALRLQPLEAKGQDLLAVVYFRLGLYPRAIDIFAELVKAFPRERTPRINLALCYLKTGQNQRARDLLEETAMLHPDYDRGWAYLGLAYEGLGDFWRAREAFLRSGQAGMARRMEERLGATNEPSGEVETPTVERYYALGSFDSGPPPGRPPDTPAVGTRSPLPSSRPAPPGHDDRTSMPTPPPPAVGGDPSAERFLRQRQAQWPRGTAPFVPHEPSGHVYVRVDDAFLCRPEALSALSPTADVPWQIEPWPAPLGGEGAWGGVPAIETAGEFVRVSGSGYLALGGVPERAPAGLSLHGGPFWIGRRAVLGVSAALALEHVIAPFEGSEAARAWVRLEGRGLVVVGLPPRHLAFRVSAGEPVLVRREAVCGWWGPLLIEPAAVVRGVGDENHTFLSFSGEGFVLTVGGA